MAHAEVEQALARLLAGAPGGGRRFVGSAFFIDPLHLLTARHCAEEAKNGEVLWIDSYLGHGEQPVTVVDSHPQRDVALLRLIEPATHAEHFLPPAPPHLSSIEGPSQKPSPHGGEGLGEGANNRFSPSPQPSPSREREIMEVWGFPSDNTQPDCRERQLLPPNPEYNALRLDQGIAKGMSGGPVLDSHGHLLGVLYGRSGEADCHYVIPLAAIADWLDEHLPKSRARALPDWLDGYLANLERRLRDMPTDVMLRSLGSGQGTQQLETRKLYVPLHVPPERPGGAAQDPASAEERKPVPLLATLARAKRLVVQGPPGCGKSTFLRYLALRLAGRLGGEPRQPAEKEEPLPEALDGMLPLFVELKPFYERHLQPNLRSNGYPPAPDEIDEALSDYLRATYRELREPEHRKALLTFDPSQLTSDPILPTPLWLLDGLDEINLDEAARHRFIDGLAEWSRDLPAAQGVCLTTRPYAYAGASIPGIDNRHVEPLQPKQIDAFIGRFFTSHGRLFRPDADDATLTRRAKRLQALLQAPERAPLRQLVRNPLLLTLTAALYCKDGEAALPRDRAALYEKTLEALLQRWEEKLGNRSGQREYSMPEIVINHAAMHAALDRLGFDAHLGLTEADAQQRETGDITEEQIRAAFEPHLESDYHTGHVIDYLQNRTGLLLGCDGGRFRFIHRSLREFLAARYLAHSDSLEDLKHLRAACRHDPGWWREVLALMTRISDRQRNPGHTDTLLHLLLRHGPAEIAAMQDLADSDWLLTEVVAQAEAERDIPDDTVSRDRLALRQRCVDWLVHLIEDNALADNPIQREQAALTLDRFGDPRRGVGAHPDHPDLPDFDWVEIPPGNIVLEKGDGEFTIEQPFLIARYPITNAQFQLFIDDPEGRANRCWWQGFESAYAAPKSSFRPESNYPKTEVSWFEAMALCRWLTERLHEHNLIEPDWTIRLPTEWEWQQAATGGLPDNIYPWGNNFDETRANTGEGGPGHTTAVGLYRSGQSPQGVFDLAGNVWEWCLNPYDNPVELQLDNPSEFRVMRGGAWSLPGSYARAAFQYYFHSHGRNSDIGLRVLCSPPSSFTDH